MQWCKVKFNNVVFSDQKELVFCGMVFEKKRVLFNENDDGVVVLVRKK